MKYIESNVNAPIRILAASSIAASPSQPNAATASVNFFSNVEPNLPLSDKINPGDQILIYDTHEDMIEAVDDFVLRYEEHPYFLAINQNDAHV